METVMQDLRYGVRLLFKNPGFAALVALVLAMGIGANTAVFSVANALLIKPLPFDNLDRLVQVRESLPNQSQKSIAVSSADFNDWRAQNSVFEKIAAYRIRDITLTATGEPELLRGAFVSSDFFSALRVSAIQGRAFMPDETRPGNDQVAVLGHGLWQRRFGGDPTVLGKTITMNGRATAVIGIMPPYLDFPFGTEVWLPLALTSGQMNQRDVRNLYVLACLKQRVSVSEARTEMIAIAGRLAKQYPNTNAGLSVQVLPMRDLQADFTRPMLSILMGMAGFLLFIACANVANLFLARAALRKREIAIRAALSASRWRLIRQFLTEGCIFSILGGTLGLLFSFWSVELIKASLPPEIARFIAGWKEIGIDARVLAFNLALSFLTIFFFSLFPAFQASRVDLNDALKEGSQSVASSPRSRRIRDLLVASELALALVLLSSAGLMIKGFWRILNVYEGDNPEHILALQTPLPESKYQEPQRVADFYQQAIQRMETLSDVEAISISSNTPLNNSPNPVVELLIEGRPALLPGERRLTDLVVISPGYFRMIGAKLLKGRDFLAGDSGEAPAVAIISDLAARRYWPNEDPVGKKIKRAESGPNAPWITIVGTVSDVKQSWFDREIRPQLYLPYLQSPRFKMTFLIRTPADPMALVPAVRSQILAVDGNQPLNEIKTLARLYMDEGSPFRFAAILMLVFGAIAFVLSAVGVYGVMSFSVVQRKREIGIRNALGAQRGDVLLLVLRQGMQTAVLGLVIGLMLSLALSRVLESALFGVVTQEYVVLLGFTMLLILISFLSSYVPAHRAAKLDPAFVLRSE